MSERHGGEMRSRYGVVRWLTFVVLGLAAVLAASAARADLNVAAGSVVNLAGAPLDLACTDLIVGGTFVTGSAPISNVRNVVIQAGGSFDAGASTISAGGGWSNAGTFLPGTSEVRFVDACGPAGTISGNTTFFDASFYSTTGKIWTFAVGSTQTVTSMLIIAGTAADPIQLKSSVPGQSAFIDLTGAQTIAHVGVTDLTATGIWLAPHLTNEGGGGNAQRWFGIPDYERIPTLSPAGLVALLLALGVIALSSLPRRRRTRR
jgi:hypothetical protein